jgi:hypothetical protein
MRRKLYKVGNAFMTAMTFSLGYTLWRIRQEVKKRQAAIDADWKEATKDDSGMV